MKMNHCFFCGTYPWMIDKQEGRWIHKTYYRIICPRCNKKTKWYRQKEKAVEEWNQKHS